MVGNCKIMNDFNRHTIPYSKLGSTRRYQSLYRRNLLLVNGKECIIAKDG